LRRPAFETSFISFAANKRGLFPEFAPCSSHAFRQLALNCRACGNTGFTDACETEGSQWKAGGYMAKLLLVAGVFGASYLWNPGFAASVDSEMRMLGWKINSTVDVRPYLPFGGRRG